MTLSATETARSSVVLTPQDFDYLRALVREKSGIVLEPGKEYLVESRLGPLVRHLRLGTIASLVQGIRQGNVELQAKVVDAMTTNETSFFRDIRPWEALKSDILPELIERRRGQRQLSLWCAAASSGQEPYTVAMLLRENFPELAAWKVQHIATDISPTMLEQCKKGRYSQLEVNRGLPASYLVRYFERNAADWIVKPDIRNTIDFRPLNLATPWPPLPRFDIVFIRNVLIYFDRETKRRILAGIKKLLMPDGYLFLGSSETTINIDENWVSRSIGKTIVYQAA